MSEFIVTVDGMGGANITTEEVVGDEFRLLTDGLLGIYAEDKLVAAFRNWLFVKEGVAA